MALASYSGHAGGGKNGLASTVCACANESDYHIGTSYTWLLCGEIFKLDIRLAVWQLCLRGDGFIIRDTRA